MIVTRLLNQNSPIINDLYNIDRNHLYFVEILTLQDLVLRFIIIIVIKDYTLISQKSQESYNSQDKTLKDNEIILFRNAKKSN